MKPAIYTRVSTPEQSTDAQLHELREYCSRQKDWMAPVEFTDVGISGAKVARPGLDAMIAAIRQRKINVVVVTAFDRLGRTVQQLLELLAEWELLGVRMVSLRQAIDTSTAAGRMLFGMLAVVAQWERENMRERIMEGLRAAKARGAKSGRPKVHTDPGLAGRVAELRGQGVPWGKIAHRLGVGTTTAFRAVHGRKGKGTGK